MPARTGDNRAAYRVLAEELRDVIRRQQYSSDGQLPTESALAADHGLSRQTVRRAYLELVAEGLIDRVPGRGTFVADRRAKYLRQFGSVEDLMGLSIDTSMRVVRPLARGVNIEAAGRLYLDSDVVHAVSFVRTHEEVPFCWTTVSLPPAVANLLGAVPELSSVGATSPLTVIGLLEGRLDDPIAEAEQSISAVSSDDQLAAVLGCAVRLPILRIDRLYLNTRGAPVELAVSYFLPDQYTYRTRLRRSLR